MNPEIKKEWVKALKSGKYKQGRRELKTKESEYCCLGVLCELHRETHPDFCWKFPQRMPSGREVIYYGSNNPRGNIEYGILPIDVFNWAGLPQSNPFVNKDTGETLASLNDGGATFDVIADIIETKF